MRHPPPSSALPASTMAVALTGLIITVLPTFLVGGLAVQIREELGFGAATLGGGISAAFLFGALAGPRMGRLADRLGPKAAVGIGASLSLLAMAGIGLFTSNLLTLVIPLGISGLGMAFVDPGLAVLITDSVKPERHGVAFGFKEAAVPASSLVAGLAVPVIGLSVGWRWAFALGIVPAIVLAVILSRLPSARSVSDHGGSQRRSGGERITRRRPPSGVYLVASATAVASMAASGVGVLFTDSAVSMGVARAMAGILLAIGGVAGICTRIGAGVIADRFGGEQLKLVASMILLGAMSMAIGAIGSTTALAVAVVGVFVGSWGWTGLLFVSLVRLRPDAPGAMAGIGLTGLALGNALGPIAFGAAAETFSYRAAWLGGGVLAAVGGWTMWKARQRVIASS